MCQAELANWETQIGTILTCPGDFESEDHERVHRALMSLQNGSPDGIITMGQYWTIFTPDRIDDCERLTLAGQVRQAFRDLELTVVDEK